MSKKIQRRAKLVAFTVLLLLALLFSILATAALRPIRTGFGCMWRSYRAEQKDSLDVLFLGTSVAYSNMIPAVIYRESGLCSFSMAGPVQTLTESYYYLRETLRTQSPSLVMLDVSGLFLANQPEYDFTNIDYMPVGLNKWRCAFATASGEDLIRYFFPLWVYHGRWSEVDRKEICRALSPAETDPKAGWTLLTDTTPFPERVPRLETWTEESFQTGAEYLRKIVELCRQEHVELLLTMSPRCTTMTPESEDKLQMLLVHLDAAYVDFDELRDEIGIDDLTDFFDSSHLNVRGAEKFSTYLAAFFVSECGLSPRNTADPIVWSERVRYYDGLDKNGPGDEEVRNEGGAAP